MNPRSLNEYPPIMDTADVAELLGLDSIATVQALVREGKIPARRIPGSRSYRFFKDELVEWFLSEATEVKRDTEDATIS